MSDTTCESTQADLHQEVEAMFAKAHLLIPEHDVHKAIDLVAKKIEAQYASKNPVVVCLMNGGLFFTSQLCQRLNFAFQMDYLHATRYQDNEPTEAVVWKAMPQVNLTGRHVIIVDDILDQGFTLKAVLDALGQQDLASLKVAVLAKKIHEHPKADIEADFVGLEVPDQYVFGCGMDYKGYYRNLSAIYATKT